MLKPSLEAQQLVAYLGDGLMRPRLTAKLQQLVAAKMLGTQIFGFPVALYDMV